MGSEQKPQTGKNEVFLADVQQWEQDDLAFQSKLSPSASYQTRLTQNIYPFNSSSDNIATFIQKLQFFGQYIECDNLMMPIYCYIREQKGICSEQKQLELYSEIYSINIKDEIVARKKHYQKFTESEVWYLLYSIVNACRKFEQYKIKSGNLKTNHVLLNQHGHIKIKNQLTEPETKTSPLPNYFAPEQLKNMRENSGTKLQPNICQTFSIAIILLEICTFIDGQSFYDMYRLKMNDTHVQRAQEMMEKLKYSKLLVNLVKIMLSGPEDRPLPSQIYLSFKPYQQQIISLQAFKFDANKIYETLHNSKASIVFNH